MSKINKCESRQCNHCVKEQRQSFGRIRISNPVFCVNDRNLQTICDECLQCYCGGHPYLHPRRTFLFLGGSESVSVIFCEKCSCIVCEQCAVLSINWCQRCYSHETKNVLSRLLHDNLHSLLQNVKLIANVEEYLLNVSSLCHVDVPYTRDWICVRCGDDSSILTSFSSVPHVKLCESCNALCCFDRIHYAQSCEFTFQVCTLCSAAICCKCNVVPDWCRKCYNREVWVPFTREMHLDLQNHLLLDICPLVTEYIFFRFALKDDTKLSFENRHYRESAAIGSLCKSSKNSR